MALNMKLCPVQSRGVQLAAGADAAFQPHARVTPQLTVSGLRGRLRSFLLSYCAVSVTTRGSSTKLAWPGAWWTRCVALR